MIDFEKSLIKTSLDTRKGHDLIAFCFLFFFTYFVLVRTVLCLHIKEGGFQLFPFPSECILLYNWYFDLSILFGTNKACT